MQLRAALPVGAGEAALEALPALRQALDGQGPLLLPHPVGSPPSQDDLAPGPLPRGARRAAVAVATSGSTGRAKRAVLTADALTSSAAAALDRLGGAGRWLLALPAWHIAGLQVLTRSAVSGLDPVALPAGPFTAGAFTEASRRMSAADRRYTALVPTQLGRLLADRDGTRALASFDGVLVGGAPTDRGMARRARAAGVPLVLTFGMTETAGGCVYDGVPLRGVALRAPIGDEPGPVLLGGPTLATGYLDDGDSRAFVDDATGRWFRTGDLGFLDADGRLRVTGRADDDIITGGLNVAPRDVEAALTSLLPPGSEVVVVGTPDREWGQRVVAAVTLASGIDGRALAGLRERARLLLPSHATPHQVVVLPSLPALGPGKPDRGAIAAMIMREWKDSSDRREGGPP